MVVVGIGVDKLWLFPSGGISTSSMQNFFRVMMAVGLANNALSTASRCGVSRAEMSSNNVRASSMRCWVVLFSFIADHLTYAATCNERASIINNTIYTPDQVANWVNCSRRVGRLRLGNCRPTPTAQPPTATFCLLSS